MMDFDAEDAWLANALGIDSTDGIASGIYSEHLSAEKNVSLSPSSSLSLSLSLASHNIISLSHTLSLTHTHNRALSLSLSLLAPRFSSHRASLFSSLPASLLSR